MPYPHFFKEYSFLETTLIQYNKPSAYREVFHLFTFTKLKHHLFQYKFHYLTIFALFLVGFFIGGFYSNALSASDFSSAKETAEAFISSAKAHTLDYRLMLWEDVSCFLWIFLSGIVLFGFPGTLFFNFKCGFSAGFFLCFLIKAYALKGFILSIFFLFCQLLFVLPALLLITAKALHISLFITSCTLRTHISKTSIKSELFLYVCHFLISVIIAGTGTMIKFFLLPALCNYLFV